LVFRLLMVSCIPVSFSLPLVSRLFLVFSFFVTSFWKDGFAEWVVLCDGPAFFFFSLGGGGFFVSSFPLHVSEYEFFPGVI